MPVITVSREYGSGGHCVAFELAEQLGLDFVDSKLIDEVSRRIRCSTEAVERWDERSESLIDRLLRAMQSAQPEEAATLPVAPMLEADAPPPDRVARTVRQVILEEARQGDTVLVGRGGAFILADFPGAFHLRLVADREQRITWVADRHGLPREDATRKVEDADRDRSRYIRHLFRADWSDPAHYDLVLNTGRLGFRDLGRLVLPFVQRSETRKQDQSAE